MRSDESRGGPADNDRARVRPRLRRDRGTRRRPPESCLDLTCAARNYVGDTDGGSRGETRADFLNGAVTDSGKVTDGPRPSGGSAEEAEPLLAALKPAQRRVLADLAARDVDELTRAEYERIGLVSRSQAAYDLAELVQMGLLDRVGSGRATRYRSAHPGSGRKRRWTDDRIRAELEAFCAALPDWPRAQDFRSAGRGDLYLAASRYGGIEHWAAELGYGTASGRPERRVIPRRRRRSPPPVGRRAVLVLRPAVLAGALLTLGVAGALAIASDQPERNAFRGTTAPVQRGATLSPRPGIQAGPAASPVSRGGVRDGVVLLRLHAARGSSSVTVRRGTARGAIIFAGTLARGANAWLRGERLWIRLGAPWNVDARAGGRSLDVRAARVGIVTGHGMRIVARAHRPRPAPPPPPTPPPAPAPVVVALAVSSRAAPASTPPPPAATQPVSATPQTPAPDPMPTSGPGPDPEPRP